MVNRKVVFLVSEDWYFISHRLEFARYLKHCGWDVCLATQVNTDAFASVIRESGVRLIDIPLERGRLAAVSDVLYVMRVVAVYWNERPDVVHHVAMKPVLYGSLATLFSPVRGVVSALAGMGYLFVAPHPAARAVRTAVAFVFTMLFRRQRSRVILQNREDFAMFRDVLRVPADNLRLVRGAGVSLSAYRPVVHGPRHRPVIVMVSRMLRDKGVIELVEAARFLRADGHAARIVLVGGVDPKNPSSLTTAEMEAIQAEGVVEWLGARSDIPAIYATADIAVLPSYREGLPKSLLEAAAAGLPIVTTDTSGCREVVAEGRNGFLVPVGDARALADALARVIASAALRAQMGAVSRTRAEKEFSDQSIWRQTRAIYEEVVA